VQNLTCRISVLERGLFWANLLVVVEQASSATFFPYNYDASPSILNYFALPHEKELLDRCNFTIIAEPSIVPSLEGFNEGVVLNRLSLLFFTISHRF
jgi:hypothetical protein